MLAHKASHQGKVAVEVLHGEPTVFEPLAIPAVVFTDPEIAWAGLTEEQAKRESRQFEVIRYPWAASGRAVSLGRTEGLTKFLIDPESERLLGVGIVGAGAGELVAEGVLAIEMGCTAARSRRIHPPSSHAQRNSCLRQRSLSWHRDRNLPAAHGPKNDLKSLRATPSRAAYNLIVAVVVSELPPARSS